MGDNIDYSIRDGQVRTFLLLKFHLGLVSLVNVKRFIRLLISIARLPTTTGNDVVAILCISLRVLTKKGSPAAEVKHVRRP
jgi:hypothetical protein